jgi:hypothetical protein
MKTRILAVGLAMLLLAAFTGMAYAQASSAGTGPSEIFQQKIGKAKVHDFEGTVLSHDVSCHCIVLKTAKGSLTLQDDYAKFEGDYDRAKGLKIGSKIKGNYKTVDYINYAQEIHNVE